MHIGALPASLYGRRLQSNRSILLNCSDGESFSITFHSKGHTKSLMTSQSHRQIGSYTGIAKAGSQYGNVK